MQVLVEHRGFSEGLNCDDALTKLGPGEYFNAFNFRSGTSERGKVSGLQSMPGTTLLAQTLPAGTNVELGHAEDEDRLWFLWANWNSLGNHAIYAYDTVAGIVYTALLNAQVVGGLNFDRFHRIHSCFVLNNNFYFTDNFNEPRRFNISAAIKLNQPGYATTVVPYTAPINEAVIAWIRRQPGLPPIQTKVLVLPVPSTNFINGEAFQFGYRYQYKDFELSTHSGWSNLADFNEEDPPVTKTSLGVGNSVRANDPSGGHLYLNTTFLLPGAPTPAYGSNVKAKLTRIGTAGADAVSTDIPIPLDWSGYPGIPYYQVILNGINAYFLQLPGGGSGSGGGTSSGPWFAGLSGSNVVLNINNTYDWGIGDATFPPTTEANLTLYTETAATSRQFSRIDVSLPLGEQIDQDVVQVDLIALYLVSKVAYVVRSWMTAIAADAAAITAHNSASAALTYQFFNNQLGIPLDSAYTAKPFDSVALLAQTAERAKNKNFLGGCLLGYNSPLVTSLALSFTSVTVSPTGGSGPTVTGEWYFLKFTAFPFITRSEYIMVTTRPIDPTQPTGAAQYFYTTAGAIPPFPSFISVGIINLGTTLAQVCQFYGGNTGVVIQQYTDQHASSALLSGVPAINYGVVGKALKSNASYQASIKFFDNYGRKCGSVTNSSLIVNIPDTGLGGNSYVQFLTWALNNTNALNEIMPGAYYYSVDITKCLRTRFFLQGIGFVTYAFKDPAGNYTFTNLVYSTDFAGVAINLSFLTANHMGYTFTAGDVVNFRLAGVSYSLAILAQSGSYIIAELTNVGAVGSSSLAQFEIYTPYKQISPGGEPFFEQGQIFPVANPGTISRQYTVTTGTIAGDVFLFLRINSGLAYIAETMSPNDKFYLLWFTDAGRSTLVDYIGQVNKTRTVTYSNSFIAGSKVNGLSTFDALDSVDLSAEYGDLQKLILTSKIQKEGTVMLAIGARETVSLYLGETQVAAPQGNAFLSISIGTIGTIYPLKGSLGTMNPESVCQYHGIVLWFDARNGGVAQYSENGLELISRYKMRTFWRKWANKYSSMTPAQIQTLGSEPFVIGGIDPFNGEYLLSLPKIEAVNPAGTLPGYTTSAPQNLFDIYDGQEKTMIYKIEQNKWMPPCSFRPEGLINVRNQLYAFKNGQAYLCNDTNAPANTFFGVAYPSRVMFTANDTPDVPKQYRMLNVQADLQPTSAIVHTNYPNPQITDLVSAGNADWNNLEGVFYAAIRRDRLSPQFTTPEDGLLSGDKIMSKAPMIQLNFGVDIPEGTVAITPFELKYANVGYELSKGHKTIAVK